VRAFERYVSIRAGRTLRDHVIEVSKVANGFQVATQRHGAFAATAVLVTTGATPVRLAVPGARELLNQGLSYSATTHAHLLIGKTTAVIGANERALRGMSELARVAAKVYLIAPDSDDLATAMAAALRRRPNVEVFAGYEVREIVGSANVEELVLERAGDCRRLRVDAAFVDLGLAPNSACVRRLVRTDGSGAIWVDERMATTVPGLFAAGDVTTSFGEQILIAIGDGARAALSAYDYLLARAPVPELAAGALP
jgi:thioredoxin reductase